MYHRKTRRMRWLTPSLVAMISVSGPTGQPIYRKKCGNIGWNTKQVFLTLWWKSFFKHDVPQHRKERNLSRQYTTSFIRRQNYNGEVVDRSWLCFLLYKLVLNVSIVDRCAWIRLNVRISLLEKESLPGSTLFSAYGATGTQWSI